MTPSSHLPVRNQARTGSAVTGTLRMSVALAVGQAITGLALLLTARRVAIDEFGAFAALYAASIAVSTFLDFGSSQLWTRDLSRRTDLGHFHSWLTRRTLIQAPVAVVFAMVALLVLNGGPLPTTATLALSAQALTLTLSSGSLASVRAMISPARAAWLLAAGNLLLLGCVVFSPDSSLLTMAAIGASGSWLASAGFGLWATRRKTGDGREVWRQNPWTGSSGFGIFGLAVTVQMFDVVIVGLISGSAEAGRIAAVARWVQPILLFAYAFGASAYPALAAAPSNRSAYMMLRPARSMFALVAVASVGVFAAAPWLVETLLGSDYKSSVVPLRLLALWSLPSALNQPCVAFLQARGQERFLATATFVVTALTLVAVALLARPVGAMAIPYASLAGSTALFLALAKRVHTARSSGG